MQEYQAMWRNYLNFYDRTSVRGYWMAVLFNFVATLALTLIGKIIPFLSSALFMDSLSLSLA